MSPGVGITHATEKVRPHEFNGDIRSLSRFPLAVVPSRRPYLPLLAPPKETKSPVIALQPEFLSANVPLAPMPAPTQNFAGLSFSDSCDGGQCGAGWPPDTNGDVGLDYYIQAVNDAYSIYDKTTGTLQASFTENSLFSSGPTRTVCDTNSNGDPVVLYDQLENRWILTNFAFGFNGSGKPTSPFYECIAVSKTGNPVTGGWWLYALRMDPGGTGLPPAGTINDYPKFGIWTDCLYMAANGFTEPGDSFAGTVIASFSKSDMYSGSDLNWSLGYLPYPQNVIFTMIPGNLLGSSQASLPPTGTPNYFVSESITGYTFEVRKFTAGANCGAGGTLGDPTIVSQTSYYRPDSNIVPQSGTTTKLDSLGDRLMQKVQYRRVGDTESLWVVHSVQTSSASTVMPQWAQIDVTGGTVAADPVQQQIYVPDTTLYRWMGSIAADTQGNVALGYSTSSAADFPGIAWSGRLKGDPPNNLSQTETQVIAGSGSQDNLCGGVPCHRWGDYSSMSVDPLDDCTFWYTNEYYDSQTNGNIGNWHTRIVSFAFPSCLASIVPGPPTGVTATAGDAQAWVSFTPPSYGGTGITYYTVTSNPYGVTATGPASPINITGLLNGTAYTFTVTATNAAGTGPPSDPSNSVTPNSTPATLTVSGSAGTSSGAITDSGTISCSIASDGSASGSCSEEVAAGSSVTLTATSAVVGSSVSWSGCTVSTGDTCDITLYADATVKASFDLLQVLRVQGSTPVGTYPTIQTAFDAALTGDIVELQAGTFAETPDLKSGVSIMLTGGFDQSFGSQAGFSTISGTLTISSGTVTIEDIEIK
ncbi:MAG: fibronectin type III domain-containing protein [Candidatus Sulfobium sp.]